MQTRKNCLPKRYFKKLTREIETKRSFTTVESFLNKHFYKSLLKVSLQKKLIIFLNVANV